MSTLRGTGSQPSSRELTRPRTATMESNIVGNSEHSMQSYCTDKVEGAESKFPKFGDISEVIRAFLISYILLP